MCTCLTLSIEAAYPHIRVTAIHLLDQLIESDHLMRNCFVFHRDFVHIFALKVITSARMVRAPFLLKPLVVCLLISPPEMMVSSKELARSVATRSYNTSAGHSIA